MLDHLKHSDFENLEDADCYAAKDGRPLSPPSRYSREP